MSSEMTKMEEILKKKQGVKCPVNRQLCLITSRWLRFFNNHKGHFLRKEKLVILLN